MFINTLLSHVNMMILDAGQCEELCDGVVLGRVRSEFPKL